MRHNLTRVTAVIVAVCSLMALTSCSGSTGEPEIAVTVGTAEIGSDIYAYYLDTVLQDTDDSLEQEDAMSQAQKLCENYVKINTEFSSQGLNLSSSAKAIVANEVNNLWSIYAGYYESIGVSKQTLTKIKESEAYRNDLVNAIYGAGGEKEISEEKQKEYFASTHVFFKAISAYLYTPDDSGNLVKLSETDLTALKNKFDDMKAMITGDTTIDMVNKTYEESNGGTADAEMPVLSATKGSDLYPESFFDSVVDMETDGLSVMTYDNYYFLIQKKNSDDYFDDYAMDNLIEMVEEEFATEIDARYGDIASSGDIGVQKSCYKLIEKVKKK